MATSKKLTGDASYDLTSFAADIRASLSAQQENDEAKTTPGTSGHGYEKPLANYDPDTQSWKMYGDTCLWGEQPSLESLPKSGITRNGVLYQQPAWVPITAVIASSSWPTPTAVTRPMEGNVRLYRAKIEAGEMTEAEAEAILGKSVWAAQGKIPAMWPTPTTQEVEHPNATWNDKGRRVSPNGNSHSMGLADAVRMWPTPTYGKLAGGTGGMQQIEAKYLAGEISAEERRAMRAGNGGKLNPMWVEWLMGFPTGWTDLEA
jgi:DNA (cytosine-5)-methyltransferase 1